MYKKILLKALAALISLCVCCAPAVSVKADADVTSGLLSQYVYILDCDSGQVLGDKNGEVKMHPASMTKIMTGILAIENLPSLDQTVTITTDMTKGLREQNAVVSGLQVGDSPTVRDLLYALALPSAADAANALALTVSGSMDSFVTLMNQKAAILGLAHTHFANPIGLDDDDLYSTAKDIAVLLQYSIQNTTFAEVFSTRQYTTSPVTSAPNGIQLRSGQGTAIANGNYQVDEMIGSKSGFTDDAQLCLASWNLVNDMHIIIVTAHADKSADSTGHITDLQTILTYLRNCHRTEAASPSSPIKQITLQSLFSNTFYDVYPLDTYTADAFKNDSVTCTTDLPDTITLTNENQQVAYTLTVSINNKVLQTYPCTAAIPKDTNPLSRAVRTLVQLFQ